MNAQGKGSFLPSSNNGAFVEGLKCCVTSAESHLSFVQTVTRGTHAKGSLTATKGRAPQP